MEIKDTQKCIIPDIEFHNGVIRIEGRSIQNQPPVELEKLIGRFLNYSSSPLPKTEINIYLEYVNSVANRLLMNLFIIAESLVEKGYSVNINWHYAAEDELMLDQGNIFKSLIKVPFIFVEH